MTHVTGTSVIKATVVRFTLCSICLAFAFVLLQAERWGLGHGGRLTFGQELPLPFNVLSLGINPFLLSGNGRSTYMQFIECYKFPECPNARLSPA